MNTSKRLVPQLASGNVGWFSLVLRTTNHIKSYVAKAS